MPATADGKSGDGFGGDVALDGDWALVGAEGHDSLGNNSGAAYLFRRRGTQWELEAKLLAPDGAEGDQFGSSVELSDGVVAIGAPTDDGGGSSLAGSVRIFEAVDPGWAQTASLSPLDTAFPEAAGLFGLILTLRSNTLIVNANFGATSQAGTALAYERVDGSWSNPRLVVSRGGFPLQDQRLALGGAGDVAVWSGSDVSLGQVAFILRRDNAGWYAEQRITPDVFIPNGLSGSAALDDTHLVIGLTKVDLDGIDTGIAFVAEIPPRDRDQDGLDDACEIATGAAEDCDDDGIIDDAQRPYRYADDGPVSFPTALTVQSPLNVLILNHFTVTGSSETLRSIGFVKPSLGIPVDMATAVVYRDPNGDGDPSDAILLTEQPLVLGNVKRDEFELIPIDPVEIGPTGTSFYVGFAMSVMPFQTSAALDLEWPHRQTSWYVSKVDQLDLADLSKNPPRPLELLNVNQVACLTFRLRADLVDCDASNRLDSCEIADGTLADLDGDGVPDACEPIPGDLDGDGFVTNADLGLLLGGWGPCPTPPTACDGDLDGDAMVDGADLGLLLDAWTQ